MTHPIDEKTYTVALTMADLINALDCIERRLKMGIIDPIQPSEKRELQALRRKLRPIEKVAMKEWLATRSAPPPARTWRGPIEGRSP